MELPARTLKAAFNACDPGQALPAGDPRYVDLSSGRGVEGGAVAACKKNILWSDQPLAQLFAGHRGCGKSTELKRLQRELADEGYFVAYLEAEGDLDLEDAEPADVLLALVHGIDRTLREAEMEIADELREDFLMWFADVVLETTHRKNIEAEVRSEAEVKGGIPLFAKLLARFTGWIKTGTESKKQIRRKLDSRLSQLLARGQTFIDAARSAAQEKGHEDLVLIVDSLDRIALKDLNDGRTTHEMLFIERGDLLKGLRCHAVYTVPISLLHSPKLPNLSAIFPERHVLPMVKLYDRLQKERWAPGWDLMRRVLAVRIDLDTLLSDGVVDDLIEASGGHPRHLLALARSAVAFDDAVPVTRETTGKIIQRMANDYSRAIPERFWPALAEIYRDKASQNDADHQSMLFNLYVLEYQNEKRWCDVHPVVTRLSAFQDALGTVEAREPS